jgi:hypothetical protein
VPDTITLGLSTFLISLVVVGAALALAIRVVLAEEPKPARKRRPRDRATPPARSATVERQAPPADQAPARAAVQVRPAEVALGPTRWQRLRSAVLLALLLTTLGAIAALFLVVVGFLVLTALRNAVQ